MKMKGKDPPPLLKVTNPRTSTRNMTHNLTNLRNEVYAMMSRYGRDTTGTHHGYGRDIDFTHKE